MKKDDLKLLREIQKETENGIAYIHLLQEKLGKMEIAKEVVRLEKSLQDYRARVMEQITDRGEEVYQNPFLCGIGKAASVQTRLMFDQSESHLAELILEENNREISSLYRAVNHRKFAGKQTVELANELIAYEKQQMEVFRNYL